MTSFRYKKWFTLREVLVIVIIISVGLLSVLVALTRGMTYVQKTRQKVVALALAKEGMEAVYHIRDTNWTRWAWTKDRCRLNIDPMSSIDDKQCQDNQRFMSWYYMLQRLTWAGQQYFALTWNFSQWVTIADGIDAMDSKYALCQDGGYRDSCTWSGYTTEEWIYFRQIQWYGLYLKDVAQTWWSLLVCSGWLSSECSTSRAKEFRFCSTVIYIGYTTGEIQLCGVLTNFEQ